MRKKFLMILLGTYIFSSCTTDGAISPTIDVERLSVNGIATKENPSVKVGDELELQLDLSGNGSDLKTFQAKADKNEMNLVLADYEEQNVSQDKNFTNINACKISFIDGVMHTSVKVKATVESVQEDTLVLNFYLSAKADCDGSTLEVKLKKASH